MRYWILRHKPTGGHMPELSRKTRGGYTHTEPSFFPFAPRLFHTPHAANVALGWYVKGTSATRYYRDEFGTIEDDCITTTPPPAEKPRRREDWEIVPINLRVGKPVA